MICHWNLFCGKTSKPQKPPFATYIPFDMPEQHVQLMMKKSMPESFDGIPKFGLMKTATWKCFVYGIIPHLCLLCLWEM